MPQLPTLDLTQEQFDRVAASFPGETGAEKTANYTNWLVNHLIDWVVHYEVSLIDEELNAERAQRVQQVLDSLPERPVFDGGIPPAPGSVVSSSLPDGS